MTESIMVDGVKFVPEAVTSSGVRIVVLQRGWVVVGAYSEDGDEVLVTSAKVIRRWGTTQGIGELVDGPTKDTVLDLAGTVRAHRLGVLFTLDCDGDAWRDHL